MRDTPSIPVFFVCRPSPLEIEQQCGEPVASLLSVRSSDWATLRAVQMTDRLPAMENSQSWRRPSTIVLLAAILGLWLTVGAGLAQGTESRPTTRPADLERAVAELDAAVDKAESLWKQGKSDEARVVCQRALVDARVKDAPAAWLAAMVTTLKRLGAEARRAGDLPTAFSAREAVHRWSSSSLPDDHPDLQIARGNLAVIKLELGDRRGALLLQEKVLAVWSRTLPDDHPDLQIARGNLAATRRAFGDLPGALLLQEKVLTVWSKTLPDDHPGLQAARGNLARTKCELGDFPGALLLQEKVLAVLSKTLPDDHPDLQTARGNLAATKYEVGDLPGALLLQEKVLAVSSKTLPDDHPGLQTARGNLAVTKHELGDLPGALLLQEKVLAVSSKTLPDDHPDLQTARGNLAVTKYEVGDLPGALLLQEKVLAVLSKTLPNDHPGLQTARGNLAVTKYEVGDLPGALLLQEKVLAVLSKTLPNDHPGLQTARGNLASMKGKLGDLSGALLLQEKVLAVSSKTLPDDHPDLQIARGNLASTKGKLGDLPGALLLQEKVLAVSSETLPDDHPDLQTARGNLAATKHQLGDLSGALLLQEKVLAVSSKTLPDDHPDLQTARGNLAVIKLELGDRRGALLLQEKVLAVLSKTLSNDHPGLQHARGNLAVTKRELGDLPGALLLEKKALAVLSETLPDDHPSLQIARGNLARTKRMLGQLRDAARLERNAIAGALLRLAVSEVSTRDASRLSVAAAQPLSSVGSLLEASRHTVSENRLPEELADSLIGESLALLVAIRGAESHTAELMRRVRTRDPEAFGEQSRAVAVASQALEDALVLPSEGRTNSEGVTITRDDAIRQAVLAKDRAERALMAHVPEALRASPTADDLAAGLDDGEAAVAFLRYTHLTNDTDKPWITTSEARFAAFVLAPSGDVTWHSLAPATSIEGVIASVRKLAIGGASDERIAEELGVLRELLFDPVLGALPPGTERLVLSLADELQLVPVDHLPMVDGEALGRRMQMQIVPSLRVLTREAAELATNADHTMLAFGNIDYDARPEEPAPVFVGTATPLVMDASYEKGAGDGMRGGGETGEITTPKAFARLPGTEATAVGELFAGAFDGVAPIVLQNAEASEAAFVGLARGKRFLHLVTHGYFAPESAWRATESPSLDGLSRFDVGIKNRVGQLSPFSLTGIALAGFNLEADELGRREGILTAQEISQLDLTSCELVALSACQTSLGVRRGGAGLASLRTAFHAAGCRYVLATLWSVHNGHAEKLMKDFYKRLWEHGDDPCTALRIAQQIAWRDQVPFRDWAGWMITGR